MQSTQEIALKAFLDYSLGADHMFVPEKFKKGKGHREPCDLAFSNDDVTVLFYARSSGEGLDQQMEHNLRQAEGYLRLWQTDQTQYVLKGNYSSSGRAFVRYRNVKCLVVLSVVSRRCGLIIHKCEEMSAAGPHHLYASIPEHLLLWLAQVGGSVVDIILIIGSMIDGGHLPLDDEARYELLKDYTADHIRRCFSTARLNDPPGNYRPSSADDVEFIRRTLVGMRCATVYRGSSGRAVANRIFADMSLWEYRRLALAADQAIRMSGPNFEMYTIGLLKGGESGNYDIVIATINARARNTPEVVSEVSKLHSTQHPNAAVFVFGYLNDEYDVRVPLFVIPPLSPPPMQVTKLIGLLTSPEGRPTTMLWRLRACATRSKV